LGNLESTVGASLLVRYGTGLSRSFPAAAVNGYSVDPFAVRTTDPLVSGSARQMFGSLTCLIRFE
jgi:hypothetical protein